MVIKYGILRSTVGFRRNLRQHLQVFRNKKWLWIFLDELLLYVLQPPLLLCRDPKDHTKRKPLRCENDYDIGARAIAPVANVAKNRHCPCWSLARWTSSASDIHWRWYSAMLPRCIHYLRGNSLLLRRLNSAMEHLAERSTIAAVPNRELNLGNRIIGLGLLEYRCTWLKQKPIFWKYPAFVFSAKKRAQQQSENVATPQITSIFYFITLV